MNRLILIGNGFDLAHGMKTSYNDFILWYLKKCFAEASESGNYSDEFIEISSTRYFNHWKNNLKGDYSEIVEHYFKSDIYRLFREENIHLDDYVIKYNPFKTVVQSEFFDLLLSKCVNLNWVDIENEFYNELIKILLDTSYPFDGRTLEIKKKEDLLKLNQSLTIIIQKLQEYLSTIEAKIFNEDYLKILQAPIIRNEIVIKNLLRNLNELPSKTTVLNFNYTSTVKTYLRNAHLEFEINYIHGKISDSNNPLIFGFGDELDSDYSKLELQKVNDFFEYIKSFWYSKTSNYHNLVRFVDSEEFQVYILGHSCGLSDRTMLNMIFEHENCKSIKIFYHGTKEKNNYTNLTQEISRHFKDKGMMRKKIVPFDKSEPMPQVE